MSFARPKSLVLEEGCADSPLAQQILRACPEVPLTMLPSADRVEAPRHCWILRRHRGRFLKPCPGTRNYLCCGYRVLNLVHGCPFGCAYCILQDYLENQGITIFVNLEEAFQEVRQFLARSRGIIRIGTGELADSLALEPWLGLGERLVPFFRDLPGGMLELKTKSAHVGPLLDLPHGGHTVISWSLNPPPVIRRAEAGTPSLEQRLEAAQRCQQRGYPLALHFDPLVMTEGWEDQYRELVRRVFRNLDPRSILWVSLGALRYPPSLHERILSCGLGPEEIFPGLDGKSRYLRPLRTRMFESMVRWLREMGGNDLFVYLCMESPEVWQRAIGWIPRDTADLDARFQRRIHRFWQRQ